MSATTSSRELPSIYDQKLPTEDAPAFNWHDLHITALNIAGIIQAIHEKGYVLGDIKPENILVSDRALVTIINTDSFQVCDSKTGKIYYASLGSASFTPLELIGKKLHPTEQTEIHDRFRLAILIHYLLFGYHSFSGEWIGEGGLPDRTELIRKGFWYGSKKGLIPLRKTVITLDVVHPEIKRLFFKCFSDGHEAPRLRPTAKDWQHALQVAVDDLTICSQVNSHYYNQSYGKCYWCQRTSSLGADIFPDANKISTSVADKNLESVSPATSNSTIATPSTSQTSQSSTYQSLNNSLSIQSPNRRPSLPVKSTSSSPNQNNSFINILLVGGVVLLLGLGIYNPLRSAWLFSAEIAAWKKVAVIKTFTGIASAVESIAISPDGQILVSGNSDGTIKVWNLSQGLEIRTIQGHRYKVVSIAISPDGQTLVSCSESEIKAWNLATGEEIFTIKSRFTFVESIAISPDGQTLVSGGRDIKVWNLSTGEEIRTIDEFVGVESIAISPDGQTVIAGTSSSGTKMWNLSTGQKVRTFYGQSKLKGSSDYVTAVAISPDGQTVIGSTPFVGVIEVWDTSTGKELFTLDTTPTDFSDHLNVDASEEVSAVAINPNGKILVSGSRDGTIKVWNLAKGLEIFALKEHLNGISSVAISSDGQTLVSGSWDGTIKVWRIAR